MKRIAASLLLAVVCLPALAQTSPYTTAFPVVENPIAESGRWLNGKATGANWNNSAVASAAFAQGTQSAFPTGGYGADDSTSVLVGTFPQNQSVSVTVHTTSAVPNANSEEVEARLNTSITAGKITGYEFNCSVNLTQPHAEIVRWNGSLGDFTYLTPAGKGPACKNGDVLTATNVGGLLTLSVTSGTTTTVVGTATDTTYPGGAPGIGFYIGGLFTNVTAAKANAAFGASKFTASWGATSGGGGTGGGGTTTPAPQVHLTCTNPNATGTIEVYRWVASGTPALLGVTPNATCDYLDATVVPGTTYNYYVDALVGADRSVPSNATSVIVPAAAPAQPATPTNLTGAVVTQ